MNWSCKFGSSFVFYAFLRNWYGVELTINNCVDWHLYKPTWISMLVKELGWMVFLRLRFEVTHLKHDNWSIYNYCIQIISYQLRYNEIVTIEFEICVHCGISRSTTCRHPWWPYWSSILQLYVCCCWVRHFDSLRTYYSMN